MVATQLGHHLCGMGHQKKNRSISFFLLVRRSIFAAILLMGCGGSHNESVTWSNLTHLNRLYEEIQIENKGMAIIHIYSEYPDYGWVDAGDEGIACVDDAARAAVVYLRHYELTAEPSSLHRGRQLIEFCRYMQEDDGLFYNFIYKDHSINRHGQTSFKSLGWWTGRGVWALGVGYRIYSESDPSYALQLQSHIQGVFPHIDSLLANNASVDTVDGFAVPRWLLYHSAADATTELMLGLADYAAASGDDRALGYLERFSDGLIKMQLGNPQRYPYGAFLSWRNVWHGWGNSQTQALAAIAGITNRPDFLAAAETEASNFYPHWISQGWPREITFAIDDTIHAASIDTFPQIAYALRPMIVGSLRLFDATGKEHFATLAGDMATWFFGNNPAQRIMYDAKTGRGFDGILSGTEINRNAGAESTIEALLALLEIEHHSIAVRRLQAYLRSH